MKLFPQLGEDLLDADSLPSTDRTELNYRPRPLSLSQEARLTMLVLLVPVPVLTSLAALANIVLSLHRAMENLMLVVLTGLALWLAVRRLVGASVWYVCLASVLSCSALISGRLWLWIDRAPAMSSAVAVFLAWITACLVSRQVAAWILVGPAVDHETMQRWKVNLPGIAPSGLSLECPELLTYSVAIFLIGPAWAAGVWVAAEICGQLWLWPVCFFGTMHAAWFGWHLSCPLVPCPHLANSWWMTIRAITTFVTYDVHATPAAGVFRFPTRWLRLAQNRWLWLIAVELVIAFGYSAACPSPAQTFFEQGVYLRQLGLNLLSMAIAAPLVLVTILWWTCGTLLARFDSELASPQSDDVTPWDVYVDRIVNSRDPLESEHILYGATLVGDYPVLVHREIYDQHGHILGDSGANKTSLGISPQATQLIARGDSTVVIVDLKGDRALFATCMREAARTRNLRFRWISNEVGTTTFGFNPFLQSHNANLSVEQFVQQLLQGLSLDYGIKYGAGYFTAMNEIVLTNVLKHRGVNSFRELDNFLRDEDEYGRIGGDKADWKQARHLASLVSRLGGTDAINLTPGMHPMQPEVHSDAIDVIELFDEPQVVYLSLRSSVEPTNAPAIARLFLWAMFTAASQRQDHEHRVYFFLDEFQQVISDGIKLIFEQFRDQGGTIIAAHQTAGQLSRQGTDLGDTVDSCTAVKQVFRASDLNSLERIEKLAGSRREKTASWFQKYEPGTGDLIERYDEIHAREGLVRAQYEERARLERTRLLQLSSSRMVSLVRFTFGSGYTQFAGATVPIVSQFPYSLGVYNDRKKQDWPTAQGAFRILPRPFRLAASVGGSEVTANPETGAEMAPNFIDEFEMRSREA